VFSRVSRVSNVSMVRIRVIVRVKVQLLFD